MQALNTGEVFPTQDVAALGGGQLSLGAPSKGFDWQLLIIYRGLHCPLCVEYLADLEALLPDFHAAGCDVVVASGDPQDKAAKMQSECALSMPVGYGLTTDQMISMGLYVSNPRSPQEADGRAFAEPGLFVIMPEGVLRMVDISNAPFLRPPLANVLRGMKANQSDDYPTRGTFGR